MNHGEDSPLIHRRTLFPKKLSSSPRDKEEALHFLNLDPFKIVDCGVNALKGKKDKKRFLSYGNNISIIDKVH